MSPRPSAGRLLDLVAVLLVIGGIALYVYAHMGMQALEAGRIERVEGRNLMDHFDRYWRFSRYALSLVAAGALTGVYSYFRYFRGRDYSVSRTPPPPPAPSAPPPVP